MAGSIAEQLKLIEKQIQKQINDVLNKEVAEAVKDEIVMAVDDVVYGSGIPTEYVRRGLSTSSNGLGGKSQMHHTVNTNGVLTVTDDADFNHDFAKNNHGYGTIDMSKSLTENIEYGYGSKSEWWNEPRPFIKKAKDNLKSNKYHVERMKEGLVKRGFKVV